MTQPLQNVLDIDDIVTALVNSVTIESLSEMTSQLASAASSAHTTLDTKLTNEVTRLDESVAIALAAANKLEAYEKQQIEEILSGLISQEGFQQLLENTCIDINGVDKSLDSVLQHIVNAEQVVKTTMLSDANGIYNGAKLSLTSNIDCVLDLVKTIEDEDTAEEHIKYSFVTDNWAETGLPAGFYLLTKEIKKTLTMFGSDTVLKVGEKILEQTNLVFDLTGTLNDCSPDTVVATPDIDGDGLIGGLQYQMGADGIGVEHQMGG